jgi:hypothetical protein
VRKWLRGYQSTRPGGPPLPRFILGRAIEVIIRFRYGSRGLAGLVRSSSNDTSVRSTISVSISGEERSTPVPPLPVHRCVPLHDAQAERLSEVEPISDVSKQAYPVGQIGGRIGDLEELVPTGGS